MFDFLQPKPGMRRSADYPTHNRWKIRVSLTVLMQTRSPDETSRIQRHP